MHLASYSEPNERQIVFLERAVPNLMGDYQTQKYVSRMFLAVCASWLMYGL